MQTQPVAKWAHLPGLPFCSKLLKAKQKLPMFSLGFFWDKIQKSILSRWYHVSNTCDLRVVLCSDQEDVIVLGDREKGVSDTELVKAVLIGFHNPLFSS